MMATVDEFLEWSRARVGLSKAPRAVVTVHSSHLTFQQPKVVDALVRAGETGRLRRGDLRSGRRLRPRGLRKADAGVPPAGRRPYVPQHRFAGLSREAGGAAPALDLLPQPIDRRLARQPAGVAPSEIAFHITGQELMGAIEPQIGCGTVHGGGSDEAFTPIAERIEHLAARAAAWARLAQFRNARRKWPSSITIAIWVNRSSCGAPQPACS